MKLLFRILRAPFLFVPALMLTIMDWTFNWLYYDWRLNAFGGLVTWKDKLVDRWLRLLNPQMYWCEQCVAGNHEKMHRSPGLNIHGADVLFCKKTGCECPERLPIGRRFKHPRLPETW